MILIVYQNTVIHSVVYYKDNKHYVGSIDDALNSASKNLNIPKTELEAWPVPEGQEEQFLTTYNEFMHINRDENGNLLSIEISPTLFLHIALSGGDGDDPPGILNNGFDALTINAVLRATEEPENPIIKISGSWRITIRDDTDAIYDVVQISMIDGEVNAAYTTTAKPTICKLDESDLSPIPDPLGGPPYIIKLAGQTEWKVYRTL